MPWPGLKEMAGEASADPEGPEPRLTRYKRLGSDSPKEQGPVAKERKMQGVDSAELMGGSKEGENTAAAAAGADSSALAFAARPLPPRWPPYPKSGKMKDRKKWDLECRRLANIPDPRHNLPTLRKPNDPYTADAVASTKHKKVVLQAALSVVTVSSTAPDGTEITGYTGIIVGWEEAKKCARILTCSAIVCAKGRLLDPQPKLSVCLPDKTISEGRLLFFNDHYDIALLEISADSPLQLPSFGSNPNYGQEVFMLARDEESSLVARHGTILWSEESDYLGRDYYMFLSCKVPEGGTGGPAIDHDGSVTGMAFHVSSRSAILAISTILTCIDMWTMFGRIARPILGMNFKTVALLDISLQEEIFLNYKINDGFIVYQFRRRAHPPPPLLATRTLTPVHRYMVAALGLLAARVVAHHLALHRPAICGSGSDPDVGMVLTTRNDADGDSVGGRRSAVMIYVCLCSEGCTEAFYNQLVIVNGVNHHVCLMH